MSRYSTISVPEDIKATLEKTKGDKDWGEYLLGLYESAEKAKKQEAFNELIEIIDEEDIKGIEESAKKFREEFKLR